MMLVIERVDAFVDREGDERGAIGRGEWTRGKDSAEGGANLRERLVGGETAGVRLPTEACRDVRQLVRHPAALEIALDRGTEQGARFAGKGRHGGEGCDRLFRRIELLGQDG